MIKNKKGDITITILVVGVFLLGAFALFSFFVSDSKTTNSFASVYVMEIANSQIEEYKFYKNSGVPVEKINGFFEIVEKQGIKYIHLEKETSNFIKSKKTLLISVDYPLR